MKFIYQAILTLFLLNASTTVYAVANNTIFDRVTGDWYWPENGAKCTVQFITISFSDNYKRALFNYSDGTLGTDGKPAPDSKYTIFSYDKSSITMLLDGEKRTTKLGEPVKWVLELVEDDVWIWRMQHWPETISNKGKKI